MAQIQNATHNTDNRPLIPEILAAAGWESNINLRYPYKQQFRKEGERFNEYCADVAFIVFVKNKVSFYYYDDTTGQKADIRISKNITVGEFNMLLDIVKLEKFKLCTKILTKSFSITDRS